MRAGGCSYLMVNADSGSTSRPNRLQGSYWSARVTILHVVVILDDAHSQKKTADEVEGLFVPEVRMI
jgi:hypothetical protein